MKIRRTKKSLIKIIFFIALFSFSMPVLLCKEKVFTIKSGIHYFYPSEQSTKDIYGGRAVIWGEIDIKIWRFLDLWLTASYYNRRGNLPFTKQATRLTLIPLGGGAKIILKSGKINPYVALGPVIYFYREKNPIGLVKGNKVGIISQAGCYFKVMGGLLVDISIDYSYCMVRPQRIKADLGGIKAGIGIGFEF